MSISGLTRLIQQANLASAPFAELAYRNASTLKELRVRTGTEANWRTLIYGGTSTPTVYSSLALFDLNIGNIRHSATWAPINKVVPFPALVRLEIREEYPFVDDLFLKGNDDTLISLHLPFCALIRNVLGRSGILNRSSISRLNSVTIGLAPDPSRVLAFNVPRGVIGKQVHRLLEMTTTLKLMNDPTGGQVHKALRTAPDTATLQHLEFIAKPLDVSQIIKIISALSSLVSLACQTLGIGTRLESIPPHELPSTLHAKHYPLSNKFRKLQLSMATSVSVKPMTLVAILIAIVCPNLSHVELQPQYRTVFWHAVTSAMARPDYKPYADTLRRLI
ncbi:hypothetical protein FBU31_005531 [Coemansia sp. 'formosensis']|nr:hypothetical protein FBU31_005531 [Coemansia sp. 'formosensis']